MTKPKYSLEQFYIAKHLLRWTLLIFPVAVSIGLLVAFFLWVLDIATATRWQNMWLIFFLPLAGILNHPHGWSTSPALACNILNLLYLNITSNCLSYSYRVGNTCALI
jgi:hypothetical protein